MRRNMTQPNQPQTSQEQSLLICKICNQDRHNKNNIKWCDRSDLEIRHDNLQQKVSELEAENKKLREALSFYASWANWKDAKICEPDRILVEFHGNPPFSEYIGGKRAIQALKGEEK